MQEYFNLGIFVRVAEITAMWRDKRNSPSTFIVLQHLLLQDGYCVGDRVKVFKPAWLLSPPSLEIWGGKLNHYFCYNYDACVMKVTMSRVSLRLFCWEGIFRLIINIKFKFIYYYADFRTPNYLMTLLTHDTLDIFLKNQNIVMRLLLLCFDAPITML